MFVRSSPLKISSTIAASRPKRSVKQPLDPEFVYDFPTSAFPTDCDPNALNATPLTAAQSAVQLSCATTPPVTKKKSTKSSKIHDQLKLERLKQQNLQLELQLLSRKEKLGAESLLSKQDKTSAADPRGHLLNDQSQEKILASLMNELTPPSQEEQHQLAHPTFPMMQQLKASAKGHTVFSAKGTLDYDKLDISEFVYAFLEFVQQQPQSYHKNLLQYLQLLMEKAINYSWSSVRNFNLSINQAFAQGRLTWDQMDVIQARSNTFFSHADLRSSQNNVGSKFTGPRQSRDSPRREQKNSYCTDWNYTAKCSCNITDVEYKNAHHCNVCDSDQHPMLHCSKRRYPIPSNMSAQSKPQ